MLSTESSKRFLEAITKADARQVRELLNTTSILQDVKWSENEHKFLSEAIQHGHYEIAKIILEKIFQVNNRIENCVTVPLHYAVRNDSLEMAILLLLRGADVNVKDEEESTPLHFAVSLQNEEMVELLLGYGANANNIDNAFGISPFQYACMKSNPKIVKSFLNHGCSVNDKFLIPDSWECPKGSTPLHLAVLHKNYAVVKMLINLHCHINDVNSEGESALHLACGESDEYTVKLLIENGALINICSYDNITPLYYAIKVKSDKIVEYLLESGAFIEYQDTNIICRPITTAIVAGCTGLMEILLKYGLKTDMKMNVSANETNEAIDPPSFLHVAIKHNQLDIVKLLLQNQENVDIVNEKRRTPLHIGAEIGNLEIIQLLLKNGASKESVDNFGYTPFHIACKSDKKKVINHFLEIGVDVNLVAESGETPLHLACSVGDIEIVKLLIKYGAFINSKADDNSTPLHCAVVNCHENVVDLLLSCNASTDIQNKEGKTVLEIAVEKQYSNIVKSLLWYNHDSNNENNRKGFLLALLQYERHGKEIFDSFLRYKFAVRAEDANKSEILFNAVRKGYYLVVEDLINYDIDINAVREKGDSLLHVATKNKQHEVVKLLIKHSADLIAKDEYGKIPIYYAIENGDEEMTEVFIENGINVREYPDLLHTVIKNWKSNAIFMLELLLKHGIDINYCNRNGSTALHLIIQSIEREENDYVNQSLDSVVQIVDYLLGQGLNVDAKTKTDSTALHMVVSIVGNANKLENLMNTVLKYNPEVNCRDIVGCTPLHLAAAKGDSVIIPILLSAGADINIRNECGMTPLDTIYSETHYYRSFLFHSPSYNVNHLFFKLAKYDDASNAFHVHIVKLKAAKLYVEESLVKNIDGYEQTKLYATCEKELNIIKSIKINKYVSLYDILAKNVTIVARYVNNEKNVKEILKITEHKKKFPIYGSLIHSQIRKAIKRKNIIFKAKESLDLISKYHLTDSCAENIFLYLDYYDLQNVVKATKKN